VRGGLHSSQVKGGAVRRASFGLSQASAAVKTDGVLSAILRARRGAYYIELERESGVAKLATSNGRERR
jgi:hypothetical protein